MSRTTFDEIDAIILTMAQENPLVKQCEIAKRMYRSQPSIGMRWKRLESEGLLKLHYGIDITKLDKMMTKVDAIIIDTEEFERLAMKCPHFTYIFRQTGNYNVCAFLIGNSLKEILKTINYHFKGITFSFQVITKSSYDIFPLKFMKECECNSNNNIIKI